MTTRERLVGCVDIIMQSKVDIRITVGPGLLLLLVTALDYAITDRRSHGRPRRDIEMVMQDMVKHLNDIAPGFRECFDHMRISRPC